MRANRQYSKYFNTFQCRFFVKELPIVSVPYRFVSPYVNDAEMLEHQQRETQPLYAEYGEYWNEMMWQIINLHPAPRMNRTNTVSVLRNTRELLVHSDGFPRNEKREQ